MILRPDEMQLSRGESVRDTALVLSRHVDAIGVRTGPDALLEELAAEGTIPVFNMLTAGHHPCQALADLLTLREAFGRLEGLKLAYVGDGNNVARSLVVLGGLAGVEVVVSSPPGYELEGVETVDRSGAGGARRARRLRRRVGLHGRRGDGRCAPRGAGALPHRRRPARPRRARRHRAALPARPSRRGDHGRGALRPAPAHLGPGREPPPRAEGAAGMAARYDAHRADLHGHARDRSAHRRAHLGRAGRRAHGGQRRRRHRQLRAARPRRHRGRAVGGDDRPAPARRRTRGAGERRGAALRRRELRRRDGRPHAAPLERLPRGLRRAAARRARSRRGLLVGPDLRRAHVAGARVLPRAHGART